MNTRTTPATPMDELGLESARPGELALDASLAGAARALDQAAARADDTAGAALPGAPGPLEHDYHADAKELVDFAAELYFPIWPRLAQVWTPDKREQLVKRGAAVMAKWKINMEVLLGKWGPEIMLGLTVVPAVVPTFKAIRDDNAEAKRKTADAARAAPPAGQEQAPPPKAPAQQTTDAAASSSSSAAPKDTLKLHEKV